MKKIESNYITPQMKNFFDNLFFEVLVQNAIEKKKKKGKKK